MSVGLTNNSVYWLYSSNIWNSRKWKQNSHKNFRNHSQEIILLPYSQCCWVIALSAVRLILLSADAHSADTVLKHRTAHIRFTRSTLCSSSTKSPSLSAVRSPRSTIRYALWIAVTSLSILHISLTLHSAFSMSWTFITDLVSPWCTPLESSNSFSYQKVLAYRQHWRQRPRGSAHF